MTTEELEHRDWHGYRLKWLQGLYPGYFAMTMATGIISVGFDVLGMTRFSDFMAVMALLTFVAVCGVYAWRIAKFPGAVWGDLLNPRLTFNFFTFVAATCIVGMILYTHGYEKTAFAFWILALIAWAALLYCSFGVLTIFHREKGINIMDGAWLICIVGTQSLVLLGLKVITEVGEYDKLMMLCLFLLWGLGLMLYAILVVLFSYRIFFLEMKTEDYTPQMWVIMGAAAISANAGSGLDMASPLITVLYEVHAVIDAIALLTWGWATWWIPLLLVIGFWRRYVKDIPFTYDPRQWSIVFPLGMYTVASYQISLAAEFEPLHQVSHYMIWAAIFVWSLLMIALLRRIFAWLFLKRPVSAS
ncbi:MAG: tellurite resistance/C4-dicarboxylate transporter family protein [Deltaproteobacteria bacterium]|nr:tellurite resistance/C4-dicarboxylate transporter family protein [Deltaproteobacteria bacterium]